MLFLSRCWSVLHPTQTLLSALRPAAPLLFSTSLLASKLQPIISSCSLLCLLCFSPSTIHDKQPNNKSSTEQQWALKQAPLSVRDFSPLHSGRVITIEITAATLLLQDIFFHRDLWSHSALRDWALTGREVYVNFWAEQHLLKPSAAWC